MATASVSVSILSQQLSHDAFSHLPCTFSGSKAVRDALTLEDISDDDEDGYSDDEEDDISIDLEDFESEDEAEESDEEPAEMPRTPARKAATVTRKSARKPAAVDNGLVDAMKTLNLAGQATSKPAFKSWSKRKTYCYFIYEYKKYNRDVAKVEIQVPPQLQPDYKITVGEDGTFIEVREKISPHFFHVGRNNKTNARNMEYNNLSAAKQAFETKIAEIRHEEDDPNAIWTDPHVIALPFACEEELIGCFVRYHKKDDEAQTDKFGAEQWEGTIHVELKSKKAIVENVLADDGAHDLID